MNRIAISRDAIWEQGKMYYLVISVDETGTLYCRIELPTKKV